jgi:hypothetical protein
VAGREVAQRRSAKVETRKRGKWEWDERGVPSVVCGAGGMRFIGSRRLRVEEFGIPWGSREGWLEGSLDF